MAVRHTFEADERCQELCSLAVSVLGFDPMAKTQVFENVYTRYIIATQMRKEGYSFKEIGGAIGKDHATIMHGVKTLRDVLGGAGLFSRRIRRMNNMFQEALNG